MSYEGYDRWLCESGHLFRADAYDYTSNPCLSMPWYEEDTRETWKCPICQARMAWWEGVNCTNDEGHPTLLEVEKEADLCTCSTCGVIHKKPGSETTYKIPEKGGHKRTIVKEI